MPAKKASKTIAKKSAKKTAKRAGTPKKATGKSGGAWADAFAPRYPGERRYWLVKSDPDDTAFDPASEGYDPKSDRAAPTWYMVDLRAVAQFTRPVTLVEIKQRKELKGMALLRIGRLSVSPVSAAEWKIICDM